VERIPILRMGDLLLVTIQVDMHDRLAMTLQDDLTSRIVATRAKGVLIDISSLEVVDSFIGRISPTLPRWHACSTREPSLSACGRRSRLRWWNSGCPCQESGPPSTWNRA